MNSGLPKNIEVRLRDHPNDLIVSASDYLFEEVSIPIPKEGQILIRNIYISVDAGSRAMLDREGYVINLRPGDAVRSSVIAEVVESKHEKFAAGDLIHGFSKWSNYGVISPDRMGSACYKIDPVAPLPTYNGMMGLTGFTAYLGMLNIGDAKPGETVVISAAAGAVGLTAGQIAKIKGARVIGVAGGPEKCEFLVDKAGFDSYADYKKGNLQKQLEVVCPDGIDVYFENVGGEVQKAVLPLMNDFGRIPLCGQIAQYGQESEPGPNWFILTLKRIKAQGFLASDHFDQLDDFFRETVEWYKSGQYKSWVTITKGIENAPDAVNSLISGTNIGKQLIQVGDDPTA